MALIPYGTRYLIVTCSHPDDRQFRGIFRVCRLLHKQKGTHHLPWQGGDLSLAGRKTLKWVAISGHGAEHTARLSDGTGDENSNTLCPGDLAIPCRTHLFLLGCYQGKDAVRKQWSRGTGINPNRLHACGGETESALSTLLLLNVLEHGEDSLYYWFRRGLEANRRFRSHFLSMKALYKKNRGDFMATIDRLSEQLDLVPFNDFLEAGKKYPRYLSGLI